MKLNNLLVLLLMIGLNSCKKFVEVDPPKNLILSSNVYNNDASATGVMRGIYTQMMNASSFVSGTTSVTIASGLSSDEFINFKPDAPSIAFYQNALTPTNFYNNLWSDPFKYINNANAVLEGLTNSTGVTSSIKQQLIGEAKFVRAFCNFYLVNLFGDIPLVTGTDYRQNAVLSRVSANDVYKQIIVDLKDAETLLPQDYAGAAGERVLPTKWAATALLARAYLFTSDWSNAEMSAGRVIANSSLFSLPTTLDSVFLKNNKEAIWQLKPTTSTGNTWEGSLFIPAAGAMPSTATLSNKLYNTFEINDNRKNKWVGTTTVNSVTYYYPYKYKVRANANTEYLNVLRLAEQYLIRSEARCQQDKISEAKVDLNLIRTRAGLTGTTATDKPSLLAAIMKERQIEFFSEWGFRWLDLKRSAAIDSVMITVAPQKGGSWDTYKAYYPIPQNEILTGHNLVQNKGYN